MNDSVGFPSLDSLTSKDLMGKTIFIRCDFNVPVKASSNHYYRVADDTRIRRFLDLTFHKIHQLTGGNCRIIIGSHLGRPHKEKDHSRWDGIFNMQFVCSHFDTLLRELYGDTYTIFPPEIIDSHLMSSLQICTDHRMPIGGIKFLPNLRYLLDPENPDSYREEFIEGLASVSDVFINCAFGCSHRLSKSIKVLPQIMRKQGKLAVGGALLHEEVKRLGEFGKLVLDQPKKTAVIAGGAKIADKIGILQEFVNAGVKLIFIGGKMVNTFLVAQKFLALSHPPSVDGIPKKLLEGDDKKNRAFIKEVEMAQTILKLAQEKDVDIVFPSDYKVVNEYMDTEFEIKDMPDFETELQLDLGPNTIDSYSDSILDGVENVFWNGPLGAYDHPGSEHYAKGSMELGKLLFTQALSHSNFNVVIGGGDSAAILNKFVIGEIRHEVKKSLINQLSPTINSNLLVVDFTDTTTYNLFNYFISNFFISTGGGAALEFLENFLKDKAKMPMGSYLPGTANLMDLASSVEFETGRISKVSAV